MLRSLPVDVARCILRYLDFVALSRLNASFDERIHRLLSVPGIIADLDSPVVKNGPFRYLLRTLRNVTRLRLVRQVKWMAADFWTLRTLNPLELEISHSLVHHEILSAIRSQPGPEDSQTVKDIRKYFSVAGLPSFEYLTPRLERIRFLEHFLSAPHGFSPSGPQVRLPCPNVLSLPPTLKHANFRGLNEDELPHLIRLLPTETLESLQLDVRVRMNIDVTDVSFRDFKALHTLVLRSLSGDWLPLEDWELPPTLTSFTADLIHLDSIGPLMSHLPQLASLDIPLILLASSLHDTEGQESHIHLASILPSTLENLTLRHDSGNFFDGRSYQCVVGFPTGLVHLALHLIFPDPFILSSFASTPSLTSLSITFTPMKHVTAEFRQRTCQDLLLTSTPGDSSRNFEDVLATFDPSTPMSLYLGDLPRGLKALNLNLPSQISLDKRAIALLPISLSSLSLAQCDLRSVQCFAKERPGCQLTVTSPIDIWRDSNAEILRDDYPLFWTPELNLDRFEQAVLQDYAKRNVRLDLSFGLAWGFEPNVHSKVTFPQTTSFIYHPDEHRSHPYQTFPHYSFIKYAFQNLQKMAINGTVDESVFSDHLPPSLTHLELGLQPLYLKDMSPIRNLVCLVAYGGIEPPTYIAKFEALPSLIHLDAPKWRFHPSDLRHRDFTRLRTCLFGLNDQELEDFSANNLSPTSRLHANLTRPNTH